MARVVFDIETVGNDFDSLDETSQESFLRFADTKQKKEDAKNSLSFYPLTGEVVAIGMLEVETKKGVVFFQNNSDQREEFVEGDITYIAGNEKEILKSFWKELSKYQQFVTFNGRLFDGPFLMLRSAIQKVKATKNLVPYRYNHNLHIDLADQMTFYDAMRRKFSLHMWCQAFGITSPKDAGVSGADVQNMYKAKKYVDIARYCVADIQATKELFLYWDKYLKF